MMTRPPPTALVFVMWHVTLACLLALPGVQLSLADTASEAAISTVDISGFDTAGRASCQDLKVGQSTLQLCGAGQPASIRSEEEQVAAADAGTSIPAGWDDTRISLDQAWTLHSRPGSKKTIYLAFRGCITENTVWNQPGVSKGENGTAIIITPPFDSDKPPSPTQFSDLELRNVIDLWRALAEIFIPFDVDVTTQQPRQEQIERASSDDTEYGIRVCFGGNASWLMPAMQTQVAMSVPDMFGRVNPVNDPANTWQDIFIFASALLPQLHRVWVLTAQQLGFTLGLKLQQTCRVNPDGSTYTQPGFYFVGSGNWAPIMNEYLTLSYFNHWSDGTYPPGFATCNPEDQLAIIGKQLTRLTDDRGNVRSDRALPLCIESNCTVKGNGGVSAVINNICYSGNDRRYYTFYAKNPGPVSILIKYVPNWNSSPFLYRKSTLRLNMTFMESSVNLDLLSDNGMLSTLQNFTATIPSAGIYTFSVTPTVQIASRSDLWLPTNYGNIGSYTLEVEFPAGMTNYDGSDQPADNVMTLHSRPTATRKIYLAFTGCRTLGQSWSTATSTLRAPASFITPPYDTDGNPAVLSAAERAEIWNIHSAVAEDFSLWDVDVTTEDPGAAGISRSSLSDVSYGVRVCIGGDGSSEGARAAVASLTPSYSEPLLANFNSFGAVKPPSSAQVPAYNDVVVWSSLLWPRVDKIWGAASKAVGRSLGLPDLQLCLEWQDTGTRADVDYPGTPGGWGAVMGDVIGNNATSQFTQWSNGSTPEWPPPCNRVDEIAIISGKLRRLYDIEGINALSGINLCADTSCSIIPGQDIVTTTYSGFTSHALDKDYFNLITNRKVNVQVTVKYTPNWYQASSANGSFLYRRSNLRLLLGVDNPNILIQKAGGFDGVMTTETTYTLIPPLSGIWNFFLAPQSMLAPGQDLPTNYGNTGRYSLSVTYPGSIDTPECSSLTDCKVSTGLCTGCKSTMNCRCFCSGAEGFTTFLRNGKPSCAFSMTWPNQVDPVVSGFYRARPGRLLRLPWLLSTRGCPLNGQRVIADGGVGMVIRSTPVACPKDYAPTELPFAAGREPLWFESCRSGVGYTVFGLPAGVNATPTPTVCRRLLIRTTDRRVSTALLWIG